MASVEKRNGAWRVRWRNPGDRSVHSRRCPSKGVAQQVRLEIEAAAALGLAWPRPEVARPRGLADLIESWLVDLARLKRAPRTIDRAQAVVDVFVPWVADRLGHEPDVSALSRATLEAYDHAMVARGNGTWARRIGMWAIGSAWRWGWERDEWRTGMAQPSVPKMPLPDRRRAHAPTVEQMDAMVAAATAGVAERRDREWVRRLVILLRGTGWRVTQLAMLDWADIDLAREEITLRPELGKSGWEKTGRTVPMAPWLAAEMRSWIPRIGRAVGREADRNSARAAMIRLWTLTGAPEDLWRQRPDHAFRAGMITALKRARLDEEAVEYYVGHAPRGMRGPYVDPSALPLAEVAAAIPAPGVPVVSREDLTSGSERPGRLA